MIETASRARPWGARSVPAVMFPAWATQSKRWWPALHLLRAIAREHPQVWDHVHFDPQPEASWIDFDALGQRGRSWAWQHWRLIRLARALHTRQRGIDVMELVDGLDEREFCLALEAMAAAGPIS
jgi:hypothetical protein